MRPFYSLMGVSMTVPLESLLIDGFVSFLLPYGSFMKRSIRRCLEKRECIELSTPLWEFRFEQKGIVVAVKLHTAVFLLPYGSFTGS